MSKVNRSLGTDAARMALIMVAVAVALSLLCPLAFWLVSMAPAAGVRP